MEQMIPLSILDLSPVPEGSDAGQALRNSIDLAGHAETLGYRRYWMAEHHNMPGIASAATAVALAHVAVATSTIRIGAGGIMLPNHAPLMIAEQFGTLAALHPGRVDLGLGRAPGSDQVAARAMRRNLAADVDQFPQDVVELMSYFLPTEPGQVLQAVPGAGKTSRSGSWDPARTVPNWPPTSVCPTPSPLISRPARWAMRSQFTANASALPIGCASPTSCSV